MNKVLLFIGIGALAAIYFSYLKKSQLTQQEAQQPKPHPKQHHLTNAFANAKKHAVKQVS